MPTHIFKFVAQRHLVLTGLDISPMAFISNRKAVWLFVHLNTNWTQYSCLPGAFKILVKALHSAETLSLPLAGIASFDSVCPLSRLLQLPTQHAHQMRQPWREIGIATRCPRTCRGPPKGITEHPVTFNFAAAVTAYLGDSCAEKT